MVRLGSKARDLVTGAEGIVTARTEWLHGCVRVLIEAVGLKDGKPIGGTWYDENRIEQIANAATSYAGQLSAPLYSLGASAVDVVTGFAGTIISRSAWLSGVITYDIAPYGLHEGKPIESGNFNEGRIQLTDQTPRRLKTEAASIGGPMPDPSSRDTAMPR